MITKQLQHRTVRVRNVLSAAGVIALASLAACDLGIDGLGPGWGDGGGTGFGGCATTCESLPWVVPYSANVLRGDTVRFIACNDYLACDAPNDTGNVQSKWAIRDSVVAVLVNGESQAIEPSKTSVLVRGIAVGKTSLTISFSKGASYGTVFEIRVADSSAINTLELPMWGYSDTVRVNAVRRIATQLRDVGGNTYRGAPETITTSDPTVMKIELVSPSYYTGSPDIQVTGLKAGTATITATFMGLTARRTLTVVP